VLAQAAVLPVALTTDASFFIDVVADIPRDAGVAIANPGEAINTVTLSLSDLDGVAVGTPRQISIPARAQVARFVSEFFGRDTVGSALRGRLRINSSAPVAVLGLRFAGAEFSTLSPALTSPISGVPVRTLPSGAEPNTPKPGTIGGSNAAIFPQFAMSGGWATQIALLNTSSSVTTGRVDVFDSGGNPLPVKMNGQYQSTFTYSIAPGGGVVIAPTDRNGQSPF
jgi:hypothetical protein